MRVSVAFLAAALGLAACSSPSDDASCDTPCFPPPANYCDGDASVSFGLRGECVEGECVFDTEQEVCEFGCEAGACLGEVGPCEGVVCDEPPAASCEGDTARTWSPVGTCRGGDCLYTRSDERCDGPNDICQAGACVDTCRGVRCNDVPPPICDGTTTVTYSGGECEAGQCVFDEERFDCTAGDPRATCEAGGCVASDRCADVVCDTPPETICQGDVQLSYYEGSCRASDGACQWRTRRINCAEDGGSCQDGVCVPDPCTDVVCDSPPAGTCASGVARTFSADGSCNAGVCEYTADTPIDCTSRGQFCADGACTDTSPCDAVVCDEPPPPSCEDNVAVYWGGGRCSDGSCTYSPVRDNCTIVGATCVDGECRTASCIGVVCDAPPAPDCDGRVAVTFEAVGSCVEGTCEYDESRANCALAGQFCDAGVCTSVDPCASVTCDAPPSAYCDADRVVLSRSPGTCEAGECTYPQTALDCAAGGGECLAASCVYPDPCDAITCDAPPADVCDGDTLLRYPDIGACDAGDCAYPPSRIDCPSALPSGYCSDGVCRSADPCYGVVCETPPASVCDGDQIRTFAAPGTCTAGRCDYDDALGEDCSLIDRGYCIDGACASSDPCFGVSCDAPDDPVCDGDTLVRSDLPGVCVDGGCEFAETRTDCSVGGGFCTDGRCQGPNPCLGVVCNAPPAPSCGGDVLTWYDNAGTCTDGICDYTFTTTDCADTGERCAAGACVPIDPCEGVTCLSPPDSLCTGDTLTEFADEGRCVDGECLYDPATTDCTLAVVDGVCRDGVCRPAAPCDDVVCDAPPSAGCDGDFVVEFHAPGTCAGGVCGYPFTPVEDCAVSELGFCDDGACSSIDPCFDVVCDSPPDNVCDGETVVAFDLPGECSGGRCLWDETRVDCTLTDRTCFAGACRDADPCVGVVCNRPPPPLCEGETVVWYQPGGTCDEGFCSYARQTTDCGAIGAFCDRGACVPNDPCLGVVCDSAPAATCEGQVAVIPLAPGVCGGGDCLYDRERQDCAAAGGRCTDGACETIDPCEGVICDSPAEAYCNGLIAVTPGLPGTCSAGVCDWTETTEDCSGDDGFCLNGQCQAVDPCLDVVCNAPPTADCNDGVASTYGFPGTCSAGECDYPRQEIDCSATGAICVAGVCEPNRICEGVLCDVPPSPRCVDGRAVRYATPGECDGGACSYTRTETVCSDTGRFCAAGECVDGDPCEGVTCETAPAAFCDGETAVSYAGGGTCADGLCSYAAARTDCTTSGGFCVAGACVDDDPCEGVACDSPPPPACASGLALQTFSLPGTCDGGTCSWAGAITDCSAAGLVCRDGACVEGDLCGALDCATLPGPYCDGNSVVESELPSECIDQACAWSEVRTDCTSDGKYCRGGACADVNPCVGVVCDSPPDDVCEAGAAVHYGTGTCSDGICRYPTTTEDCADAYCSDGECVAVDPCESVVCDTPPAPTCDGVRVVVTYGSPGSCVDGACTFATSRTPCSTTEVCDAGVCVPDPCEAVSCGDPPPAACDGEILRGFGTGSCSGGECVYSTQTIDCASFGLQCEGAACIPPDPCEDVTCDVPPAPWCNEDIRLVPSASGECVDGVCDFAPLAEDCTDYGEVCIGGTCVDDPCDTTTCDAAPAPRCEGDLRVTYPAAGVCLRGECSYAENPVRDNCAATGQTCAEGACVAPGPCTGVYCLDPPAPSCAADVATTWTTPGECVAGDCIYAPVAEDCGAADSFCAGGVCVPYDPCGGVDCSAAPASLCDGDVAVAFVEDGACDAGECVHDEVRVDCAASGQFCSGGECVADDPCSLLSCESPPLTGVCLDATTALAPAASGECVDAQCSYGDVRVECAQGTLCFRGECLADACPFVGCGVRMPTCVGETRRSDILPGVCDPLDLSCDYSASETLTDCSATGDLCYRGGCRDPNAVIRTGELVVSELLVSPSGGDTQEWIELTNRSARTVNLAGLTVEIRGGAAAEVFFGTALSLPSGSSVVLGATPGAGGGADRTWSASGDVLSASSGSIRMLFEGDEVGRFAWTAANWAIVSGASLQLDADALVLNQIGPASWCLGSSDYGGGELGSPGAPNFSCP